MNNEEKILELLGQMNVHLHSIDNRLEAMDERLDTVDKRLETVEKRLDAMDERLEIVEKRLDAMDKRLETVEKRLDVMDERLDTMDKRLDELDERSRRSAVIQENEVLPKLQLLYEGQENLRQTLAPIGRIEALEERVSTLEGIVHFLKKAQ